jgi:hypothetical protein
MLKWGLRNLKGRDMINNLYVTLTNINTNKQLRIQASQVSGYGKVTLNSTQEEVTAVYVNHPEISVLFVKQTPEQLDAYLSECYLTVKGEP